MKKKGKFIVIEGIDGSGKATQTDILTKKLKEKGYVVEIDDYPHYETSFWGKHVGRMLAGEFGDAMKINPYLTVLPYMLDERDGSERLIRPWLWAGKMVVSNRFFTSNVHQIAKIPKKDRKKYGKWLWKTGYEEMKIQRPDLVIVLLVDPSICKENIFKKSKRKYTKGEIMDLAEKDFKHQMQAMVEYRKMVKKNPDWWVAIDCCKDGKIMDKEKISQLIWEEIRRKKII
jgi:dTMP kinase